MGFFKKFSKNKNNANSSKLVPGIGRLPYPAYRGKDKYNFVSYAHMDHELVFEKIKLFNEAGFHVRYRLILPDIGIREGADYTVRKFDGRRFFFDEGYTRLLSVSGTDAQLYPLAQYDNRFRAPFLLYRTEL